jgi:predicted enzyme related to lactoylglutathione lyase
MLNLNSIMLNSSNPKALSAFYEKVLDKKPDMVENDGEWAGWMVGSSFLGIGPHSEIEGKSKEPARIMFSLETAEIQKEFDRIKDTGAEVIKEPYKVNEEMDMMIATFADPDGNYFQLMTPWKPEEKE